MCWQKPVAEEVVPGRRQHLGFRVGKSTGLKGQLAALWVSWQEQLGVGCGEVGASPAGKNGCSGFFGVLLVGA